MSLFLAMGQRSNDILALQDALNVTLPPKPPLVLDGIFGPLTQAATRQFQRREHLVADGIAGPRTLGALFEGVVVESTVDVAAVKGGSPAAGPEAAGGPSPPETPPGLSFGTIGLMSRELKVRSWIGGGFPKNRLTLAPQLTPPPIDLLALQMRGLLAKPLAPKGTGKASHSVSGKKGLAFKTEVSASTGDFKELQYKFKFSAVQPKAGGFFKPSASLKAFPGGSWTATTKLSVTPFKIPDAEWMRFSFSVKPVIAASLTTPFILGEDPSARKTKLKASAGGEAELIWRPIGSRDDFQLFFTGSLGANGFLEFKNGEVKGGFVAPDYEISGGVRLRFGLGN